jgi:hypothetical protein
MHACMHADLPISHALWLWVGPCGVLFFCFHCMHVDHAHGRGQRGPQGSSFLHFSSATAWRSLGPEPPWGGATGAGENEARGGTRTRAGVSPAARLQRAHGERRGEEIQGRRRLQNLIVNTKETYQRESPEKKRDARDSSAT